MITTNEENETNKRMDDVEVDANEINQLLGTITGSKEDEDEIGGKTVTIAELDVVGFSFT